jgi:type IV pilus assembly protein PilB
MSVYKNVDLYNTIKELSIIPTDTLDDLLEESEDKEILLGDLLIQKDLMSSKNLGRIVADMVSVAYVDLSSISIKEDILKIIPEVVARKQKIIAFKKDKEGLHIATTDPTNRNVTEFIEKKVGIPVKPYFVTERDIQGSLQLYAEDVQEAFDEIIERKVKEARGAKKPEPSIIKIVDMIITYAYQNKASDIHIEPYDEKSLVRFRIDGILHDIVDFPLELHPQIVTRVKVLAKLRTDEHQAAQDGKITSVQEGEKLDVRGSVVPITDGEKIVMSLLSEKSRQFSMQDLGFSKHDLEKVKKAYERPYGMILSTGPTGSGKTTTLYAILKLLNKRNVNIMTIEDPVEYDIEGVNQIQVNPKTELTFAKGLRSVVRQDPDIILVGEIRDEETADISINAAMTGHLVLSTLHTNDAATTIPRLLDLGVEPFLVGSTINIIIAQRLVRKICLNCRVSTEMNVSVKNIKGEKSILSETIDKYLGDGKHRVYKGKGCEVCHGTGYLGRVGIYEVMIIDDEIRKAIVEKKDSSEIKKLAIKNGMITMMENGISKVKEGITTIEEILRVTKE